MDVLAISAVAVYQLLSLLSTAGIVILSTYLTITVYHFVYFTLAGYKIGEPDLKIKQRLSLYAAPTYLALFVLFSFNPVRVMFWYFGEASLWDNNVYYAIMGALIFEAFVIVGMGMFAVPLGLMKLYDLYAARKARKAREASGLKILSDSTGEKGSRGRKKTRN